MTFVPLLRAAWLAPFGGERRLLEAASASVRRRGGSNRLYSGAESLSTAGDLRAVSLLFEAGGPGRSRRLSEEAARLPPGGGLLVLDHNAPRGPGMRLLATLPLGLARPWLGEPAGRRLRRSIAQELAALGLEVVCLRLLGRELFQAVLARRP